MDKNTPKTLEECYATLDTFSGVDEWLKLDELEAVASVHFTLGMHIRNNWGLWEQSGELYSMFEKNGIKHPDDMSAIILTSYHRFKNNEVIDLISQFISYNKYWRELKE